jgi:hypothetical protein
VDRIDYQPAGRVVESFHADSSFVRGLMGPVGSSKSSACLVELFGRGCEQAVTRKNMRETRFLVLRNTFPELKSTTIKTFLEWFPFAKMRWDSPITAEIDFYLPDKTRVRQEWIFLALERPEDIGKLKSFEATAAMMNEAGEMDKAILDMAAQRVGRYPSKKWGGPTWSGVIMDTNPPSTDHWWFRLAETEKPKGYKFFQQPGGLVFEGGEYKPNPKAENIENLPGGYEYYLRQVPGKRSEWVKVFVLGQYGIVSSGKPVYPEYRDDVHCKEITPVHGLPLVLGFDFGRTPACVICQVTPRGQLLVLDEICSEDMDISQFARDALKPHLGLNYPEWVRTGNIRSVGDPAGMRKSDTESKTCFTELANNGFVCMPAITNDPLARTSAVSKYLTRLTDGNPGMVVSPKCSVLRQGFIGGYCFERIQVTGEGRFKDRPSKNRYSHPHDALQYVALHITQIGDGSWGEKLPDRKMVAMI